MTHVTNTSIQTINFNSQLAASDKRIKPDENFKAKTAKCSVSNQIFSNLCWCHSSRRHSFTRCLTTFQIQLLVVLLLPFYGQYTGQPALIIIQNICNTHSVSKHTESEAQAVVRWGGWREWSVKCYSNRYVLRWRLKVGRVEQSLISRGMLFQILGAR